MNSTLEALGATPLELHQLECLKTLNISSREATTETGRYYFINAFKFNDMK